MKFQLYDMVQLRECVPDRGIPAGTRGAIVLVCQSAPTAYEVELCDSGGSTIAVLTLEEDQLEPASTG